MADADETPSEDLVLYLADTTLAVGLQYGLWVERSPSTEEQVALSSMSQDKLGHARAFYQIAEKVTGGSHVELLYDRPPGRFAWNPAWLAPLDRWEHLVLAQVLFSPALTYELAALDEASRLAEPRAKIEQEEVWHTRHGEAWLAQEAGQRPEAVQGALDDLWPFLVGFFGTLDEGRFPEDLASGQRTLDDETLWQRTLDEVVPTLEDAGVEVPAAREGDTWETEPTPSEALLEELGARVEAHAVELAGLVQDPEGRALAELA